MFKIAYSKPNKLKKLKNLVKKSKRRKKLRIL